MLMIIADSFIHDYIIWLNENNLGKHHNYNCKKSWEYAAAYSSNL